MPVWMYCGLSCKQCGSDTLTEADLDRIARHEGPAAPEHVWGVAGNPRSTLTLTLTLTLPLTPTLAKPRP